MTDDARLRAALQAVTDAVGQCVVCSTCRNSTGGYLICRRCWTERVEPVLLAGVEALRADGATP